MIIKARTTVIVSAVAAALGLIVAIGTDASEIALTLAEKTAQADAIVVGKVAEVEPRRYALTLDRRKTSQKPGFRKSSALSERSMSRNRRREIDQ